MGLLERQLLTRRTIATDTFCGKCGYNLRMRAIIDRCPECGNSYDARPESMEGILLDRDVRFPTPAIIGCVICGPACLGFMRMALDTGANWAFVPGALFFILFVWHVVSALRQALAYFRLKALLRQTRRGGDD